MSEMLTIYTESVRSSILKLIRATEAIRICTTDKIPQYTRDGDSAYNDANKVVSIYC